MFTVSTTGCSELIIDIDIDILSLFARCSHTQCRSCLLNSMLTWLDLLIRYPSDCHRVARCWFYIDVVVIVVEAWHSRFFWGDVLWCCCFIIKYQLQKMMFRKTKTIRDRMAMKSLRARGERCEMREMWTTAFSAWRLGWHNNNH